MCLNFRYSGAHCRSFVLICVGLMTLLLIRPLKQNPFTLEAQKVFCKVNTIYARRRSTCISVEVNDMMEN